MPGRSFNSNNDRNHATGNQTTGYSQISTMSLIAPAWKQEVAHGTRLLNFFLKGQFKKIWDFKSCVYYWVLSSNKTVHNEVCGLYRESVRYFNTLAHKTKKYLHGCRLVITLWSVPTPEGTEGWGDIQLSNTAGYDLIHHLLETLLQERRSPSWCGGTGLLTIIVISHIHQSIQSTKSLPFI